MYADLSRVYRSPDKGATWVDKTNNLPTTLPVSAIFIDPNNSSTVILGTDLGCYRSDDGGDNWFEYNTGLPNTVVTDFAYHPPTRRVRAGTYGRGMWETVIDGAPSIAVDPLSLSFSSPGSNPEPVPAPEEPQQIEPETSIVRSYPVGTGKGGQSNVADFSMLSAPARDRGAGPEPEASTVTTLLTDDFEAGTLNAQWNVFNDPTWGLDDYYKRSGQQSIWCCRGGSLGVDPEYYYYHSNADSWITAGPFDLSDAEAASFSFWRDADMDFLGTAFYVWVSTDANFDPAWTAGYFQSGGDTGGFEGFDIDHHCPVISPRNPVVCSFHPLAFCNLFAKVPVKWGFSRIA